MMLYAVPKCDPEQCQWEPRPVSGGEPQDDHNSVVGSDPLLLSDSGCSLRPLAVANAFFNGRYAEQNGRSYLVDC